jgi:hypothetical protein
LTRLYETDEWSTMANERYLRAFYQPS